MKTNPNDSVYPLRQEQTGELEYQEWGITKLEYATFSALQGLCANPNLINAVVGNNNTSTDLEVEEIPIINAVIGNNNTSTVEIKASIGNLAKELAMDTIKKLNKGE